MSKENLGHIECDACGVMANIRRRSNGRKLLYLSCPECGLDQRSGEALQRKWAKACQTQQSESLAEQSELSANQHTPAAVNPSHDEWTPPQRITNEIGANQHGESSEPNSGTSTNEKNDSSGSTSKSSLFGWLGFAAIAAIAITTGARLRAS